MQVADQDKCTDKEKGYITKMQAASAAEVRQPIKLHPPSSELSS
jgi:hypothetical protein